MTISSQTRKAGPFVGNDSSTAFPFAFKVFATSDVYVVKLNTTLGTESVLVLGTDYTVSLNSNQNSNPGGTVTLPAALATGYKLTITSALQYLQPTDLTNQGGFYPAVITNALDRLTIFCQQIYERLTRSLTLPISVSGVSTTLPVPESNALVGWNADANGLENKDPTTLATIVAFGTAEGDVFSGDGTTTTFALSSNPGALNNLDVSIGGVVQTPGIDYTWTSGANITFTTAPIAGTDNILVRYMQALPQGYTTAEGVQVSQASDYSPNTIGAFALEHLSATAFGLSPTASASANVAALLTAVARASALNRALYVPGCVGSYTINDEIPLPAGLKVYGDGFNSTIDQTVAGKNIFILADHCEVSGVHLKFSTAGNNSDFTKQNAVYGSGAKGVRVERNFIELKDIHCGVQLRSCPQATVKGNVIWGGVWDGTTAGAAATAADIVFYSGAASGRSIIEGNFCLSNNSQGIFFSALGYDADAALVGNICVTMNTSASAEVASGGVRRHGMIVTYSGTTQMRASVVGNICRNTRWTGVYIQGSGASNGGQVSVSANVCSNNGYETGNSLSGGIYVTSNGGEAVTNNIIVDFQNNISATGGITITCPAAGGTAGTSAIGNTIVGSLASGIALSNKLRDCVVKTNTIVASALNDIVVSLTSGDAGLGGLEISDNTCIRTNTSAVSIAFNQANGARRSRVFENKLRGHDYTVSSTTNIGINITGVTQPVDVVRNQIENYYYGVNIGSLLTAGTRYTTTGVVIDDNRLLTCTQGIGVSGNATTCTFVVCENIFDNCTARLGTGTATGFAALYEGRRAGTKYEVFVTAIPTGGTWAVGDRAINQAGTVGQPKAWTNTSAGSPGTFTSEGNL